MILINLLYCTVYNAVLNALVEEKLIDTTDNANIYEISYTKDGKHLKMKKKKVLSHLGQSGYNRLMIEIEVLKALSHPNIMKMYGYDNEGYLTAMPETSARDPLTKLKYFPYDFKEFANQMVSVLYELEFKEVGHMDIRPEKIVIIDGIYTLIGFDLALHGRIGRGIRGSVNYAAPEVLESKNGELYLTSKADMYSMGVTLWSLYNGEGHRDCVRDQKRVKSRFDQLINSMTDCNPQNRPSIESLFTDSWLTDED